MANAKVVKKEIEVVLTLNEDEALAVLALTGACPSLSWGGLDCTNNVYGSLHEALSDAGVGNLFKYRVVDSEGLSISPKLSGT
jgi:hypothetical protein